MNGKLANGAVDCLRNLPHSRQVVLPDPCIDGVNIVNNRGLGKAACYETGHGGEVDFAIEVLQSIAGVPKLHHLPPSIDWSGRERAPGLWRRKVADSCDNGFPVCGGTAGEERQS